MPARAHASLIASDPAPEAVLAAAPSALTLTFNEAVEPLTMQLVDQRGARSAITRIERRAASLVLMPPAALADGAYVLSWRVISADGHPVGGALTFRVGMRAAAAPPVAIADASPVHAAIWATRIVIDLGLFVGIGGAFFLAWIGRPPRRGGTRIIIAAAAVAALPALALSVGLQGLDALAAPLSALASPGTWFAGARGSFGLSAEIAAAGLIAGLSSLGLRGRAARVLSLAALLAAGCSLAATGHAATASPRGLAVAAIILHGISLAFWIGALVPLVFMIGSHRGVAPLLRFSRWIPFAVAALLASGALLATIQLEHFAALWTTAYGRVLMIKLGLVAPLLAVALWNRVRLTPNVVAGAAPSRRRMRSAILCELALVCVILGVVGLWRFTPPPRLPAAARDDFFVHLHTDKAMANVTISPATAGPVDIIVQLETPDEQLLAAMAVSVTLSNSDIGIEPITTQAERRDDDQWRARLTAPVAGRWSLGLGILISDFDKISIEAPIVIK